MDREPLTPEGAPLGLIRTDLAVEAHQAVRGAAGVPGVDMREERSDGVVVSRVVIHTEEAAARMGKPPGRYITIEARALRQRNLALQENVARTLANELQPLLPDHQEAQILVVGLGNWQATPDAIGPKVVRDLLITRHLPDYVPADLRGGLRSLAGVAPGVLGLTGIETVEIVEGIVSRVRPDAVVAVDALASRSIERILTTIQIADTGINPGSGVGNHRKGINAQTLGVPVVAIGVPTVVHATTIAQDTIDLLVQRLGSEHPFYSYLDRLDGGVKHQLIQEVLSPYVGDLMVTPKEIDMLVEDLSHLIASGINAAIHPRVGQQAKLL